MFRSEFRADTAWGQGTGVLKRYEIRAPILPGPLATLGGAVGLVHVDRCSLLLSIGGGQLRAPRSALLEHVKANARHLLQRGRDNPVDRIERMITWLETEYRNGLLVDAFVTASLLVVVSDKEVWTWTVGPVGVASGARTAVQFRSVDFRYPVLRALGILKPASFQFPATEPLDQASSVCCVGTPNGYERLVMELEKGGIVIALDRGCLPYGPLPKVPVPVKSIWELDAAWKHGLAGLAVAVGSFGIEDLGLPEEWKVMEIQEPMQG
jgi:hypothetical protein